MKVHGIRRILKSDFTDAPSWFDRLLYILNEFMDVTYSCLRGKLTFTDNFLCEVKDLIFVNGVEQFVRINSTYYGAFIVGTPNNDSINYVVNGYKIRQLDAHTIGITVTFTGGGVTSGSVKFIVLGS